MNIKWLYSHEIGDTDYLTDTTLDEMLGVDMDLPVEGLDYFLIQITEGFLLRGGNIDG